MIAVLTAVGCTSQGSLEVADDAEGKADGISRPVGTFTLAMERTDDEIGGIHLSLMTDKSFRREENLDPFVGPTIERGTYRYSKAGTGSATKHYMSLVFEDGRVEKLEYKLVDESTVLQLRRPGTTTWASYEQDSLRCDSDEDCDLQGQEGADCYYSGCIDELPEP